MNFLMRFFCCFIAVLIAGKEVVAFGHLSISTPGASMSDYTGEGAGDWVMECEEAPETESLTNEVYADSTLAGECDSEIRIWWTLRLPACAHALTKFAVTEFYIYVLNLRL